MAPRFTPSARDVIRPQEASSSFSASRMELERNGGNLPAAGSTKQDECLVATRQTTIDSDQWKIGAKAVRHLRRRLQLPQHAHLLRRLEDIKDERSVEEQEAVGKLRRVLSSRNLLAPSHDEYYTLVR